MSLPRASQALLAGLQRRAGQILGELRGLGVDHAELRLEHGQSLSASVRDGALEQVGEAQNLALSLRLVCAGRVATVTSSDLRPAALSPLLARAAQLARLARHQPDFVVPGFYVFVPQPQGLSNPYTGLVQQPQ